MSEASETIARQVRNAVRETVNTRRIQGSAGANGRRRASTRFSSVGHMTSCGPWPPIRARSSTPSCRASFMLQAFLEIDATEAAVAGGEGWLPTAENVNALPEGIRRYVHDLETRCDPAHDVQKMALQADTIRGLDAKVRELEAQLVAVRQRARGEERKPQ